MSSSPSAPPGPPGPSAPSGSAGPPRNMSLRYLTLFLKSNTARTTAPITPQIEVSDQPVKQSTPTMSSMMKPMMVPL